MEIILQQDYPQVGFIGERVSVKSGYARNFLIPKGIAVEASSKNARALKHKLALIDAIRLKSKKEAEQIASTLGERTLNFKLKIGESGKSYGSIGPRDIELQLKEIGYTVDRRQISLLEPIRGAGNFTCKIKLHSEVVVKLALKVDADALPRTRREEAEPEQAEAEGHDETMEEEGEEE